MKLKTSFIIDLLKREIESLAVPFYIEKKGDPDAGAIYLKHDLMNGLIILYHRIYNDQAEKKFCSFDVFDRYKCDEFIQKQKTIDVDIWIIEVEVKDFNLNEVFLKLGL